MSEKSTWQRIAVTKFCKINSRDQRRFENHTPTRINQIINHIVFFCYIKYYEINRVHIESYIKTEVNTVEFVYCDSIYNIPTTYHAVIVVFSYNRLCNLFDQNEVAYLLLLQRIGFIDTDFDDEDDVPLSLCVRNLNSKTMVSPGIWKDQVDIDRGGITWIKSQSQNGHLF